MSDTNTARDVLRTALAFAWVRPDRPLAELDALLDEYDAARRNEAFAEAAELLGQHRGDLCDGHPWWDTRDRDTAIAVLLAARTTTAPTTAAQPAECRAPHHVVDGTRCQREPGHDGWHAGEVGSWPTTALPFGITAPTTKES